MGEESKIVSEYYFNCKIENVLLEDESILTPKLYFERDYTDLSQYILYTVPEEWRDKDKLISLIKKSNINADLKNRAVDTISVNGKSKKTTFWTVISKDGKSISDICDLLPYDSVIIYYDTHGLDASVFTNAKADVHKKAAADNLKYSLDKFWSDGCRLKVLKGDSINYSGVGQIEYRKGEKTVAKFFFAINYALRKKISYSLTLNKNARKDTIKLEFECDNAPVGIEANLLCTNGRLPCLENDARNCKVGKPFTLDFKKAVGKSKYTYEIEIEAEGSLDGTMYSVAFDDVDMERYYVLSCNSNSTLPKKQAVAEKKPIAWKSSCPYCHSLLDSHFSYVKGGVSCQGKQQVKIYEKRKQQESKNVIYCQGDLSENGGFHSDYRRILPKDFLSHNNFKVAFTGATRAGKTTYISRLFGINKHGTDKEYTAITLDMIKKPLERFDVLIKHAEVPRLGPMETNGKGKGLVVDEKNWDDYNSYYGARAVDLKLGMFPTGTQTGLDFSKYPFCLSAERISSKSKSHNYISFYDVAGEDVTESSENIKIVGSNKIPIGIFLLVNGSAGQDFNKSVVEHLISAVSDEGVIDGISNRSPVAVILTKLDILREEFDSNCHCLRTDYLNYSIDKYDGSYLEKEIDISSEEVRSYLSQNASETLALENKFETVKYFALSSFNYSDSIIHKKDENENDPGELKFESSGFRLELPLVWMLRQFGIID